MLSTPPLIRQTNCDQQFLGFGTWLEGGIQTHSYGACAPIEMPKKVKELRFARADAEHWLSSHHFLLR